MEHRGRKSGAGLTDTHDSNTATALKQEGQPPADIFADLEATLDQVAEENPRIDSQKSEGLSGESDLKALLEASLVVNSSLVLDDVLEIVMGKVIELMKAERGLIMLLDHHGNLQTRTAYNLADEDTSSD